MPDATRRAPRPSSRSRRGPFASGYSEQMSSVLAAVDTVRDAIRRHPWWTDSLLALFVTFISLGSVAFSGGHGPDARSLSVLDAILVPVTSLPIAARRYRPLMVLAITVGAETVLLLFSSRVQFPFGVIVALYTVASRCERPVAARAAGVGRAADHGRCHRQRLGPSGAGDPAPGGRRDRVAGRRQSPHAQGVPRAARGASRAPRARARTAGDARHARGARSDRSRAARRDRPQRQRDGRSGFCGRGRVRFGSRARARGAGGGRVDRPRRVSGIAPAAGRDPPGRPGSAVVCAPARDRRA